MIIAITILVLGAGIGQMPATSLFGSVIPEDAATFTWDKNAVAFRVEKEWIADLESLEDNQTVEVVLDTPWNMQQSTSRLARSIKAAEKEYSTRRKDRLREGWKNAGFVSITSSLGGEVFVREAELKVATEAEQKEHELLASWHPAPVANSEQVPDAAVQAPAESPGIMHQWGGHIVLVLVAAGLIGVVVKLLILES